jgi:hypothetical protein
MIAVKLRLSIEELRLERESSLPFAHYEDARRSVVPGTASVLHLPKAVSS